MTLTESVRGMKIIYMFVYVFMSVYVTVCEYICKGDTKTLPYRRQCSYYQ